MDTVFSFRLDSRTSEKLILLAHETHRSRGAVIRWLIDSFVDQREILPPKFDSSEIPPISETSFINDEEDVEVLG